MLILFDTQPGIIVFLVLIFIGIFTYINMKNNSKEIRCINCGAVVYVEQMKAENCTECGARLN